MILPFSVPLITFIGIVVAHRHCDLAIIAHAGARGWIGNIPRRQPGALLSCVLGAGRPRRSGPPKHYCELRNVVFARRLPLLLLLPLTELLQLLLQILVRLRLRLLLRQLHTATYCYCYCHSCH